MKKRSSRVAHNSELDFFSSTACLPIRPILGRNRNVGGKYLVSVSSRFVKMRDFSFLSWYKSLFIFQFLNVKMYNYVKQNTIVNFIIKKLKKIQFPQKV